MTRLVDFYASGNNRGTRLAIRSVNHGWRVLNQPPVAKAKSVMLLLPAEIAALAVESLQSQPDRDEAKERRDKCKVTLHHTNEDKRML